MSYDLSAAETQKRYLEDDLTVEEQTRNLLTRIEATERDIKAWEYLDPQLALSQAQELNALKGSTGPLHGLSVGIKDIFNTKDQPTRHGSAIYQDNQPDQDAAVIRTLRKAGAIILGKTVTTEFAFLDQKKTRNPHDLNRTPGGSSSGSAAAVAAGQVALALGSQTNGSTIRPASFSGVYGFKPTRGLISREGVLRTSQTLDQVGLFGRNLEDLALLGDTLFEDRDGLEEFGDLPIPQLRRGVHEALSSPPRVALIDFPYYERMNADCFACFNNFVQSFDDLSRQLPVPDMTPSILQAQSIIHEREIAHHLSVERRDQADLLSEKILNAMARGDARSEEEYQGALAVMKPAQEQLMSIFDSVDLIMTPASCGEAPPYEEGTGDPIFATLWTFSGFPALSVPWLLGPSGLPMGIQLIAAPGKDDLLLRLANWLLQHYGFADPKVVQPSPSR